MNRIVIAVLVALATRGASAGSPRPWAFHHERFDLTLPQGWHAAWLETATGKRRFEAVEDWRAVAIASEVHFADSAGNYFTVSVDGGTEAEFDVVWDVRAGKDGASIELLREGAPCTRPKEADAEDLCTQGNGSLELVAQPPLELQGAWFAFEFGNVRRETGVDLAPFRKILRSFRAHPVASRAEDPARALGRDPAAPVREAYRIERIQLADRGPERPGRPVAPWFEPHRSRLFSKRFAALWDADDRCFRETGGICNMDLDPFIWGQDFTDPKLPDLVVDVVRRAGDRAEVRARFTNFQPKQVTFDVIREHGRWVIDDIRGPDGSVAASLGR